MSRFGKGKKLYEPLNTEYLQQLTETLKGKPKETLKVNLKGKEQKNEENYKKMMNAIVDSLPVDDKESIKKNIVKYGTDFPLYAQCQSNDSEEENPWVTALLSLSVMVLDNMVLDTV